MLDKVVEEYIKVEDSASNSSDSLIEAVHSNDVKTVEKILKTGLNPNHVWIGGTNKEENILILAIKMSRLQIVKLLLQYGAYPHITNSNGYTPIHFAVKQANVEILEELLNKAVMYVGKRLLGMYIKHAIVISSPVDVLNILLREISLINNSSDVIDTYITISKPTPVLTYAIYTYQYENTQLLIEHNAYVNISDPISGRTPLMAALALSNVDASLKFSKLLLSAGSDVNALDFNRITPLHIAIDRQNASLEIIKLLLEFGAYQTINHENLLGSTALTLAIDYNRPEVVKLLMDFGATLDSVHPKYRKLKSILRKNHA